MPGPLLDTLKGVRQPVAPVWLMRQAGRYLPEYRALRAEKGFPRARLRQRGRGRDHGAADPAFRLRRGDPVLRHPDRAACDGAGPDLPGGRGAALAPTLLEVDLDSFTPAFQRFEPVYETVRLTRKQIGPAVTMLGFAGSPWTVATYMIAGQGSKDQGPARLLAYRDPGHLQAIIDAIVDVSVTYLRGQIDAGAEAVQLFDSWAGSLAPDQFERWVIAPNAAITTKLKESHPDTPVIGFPKGAGAKLPAYARETGVDAVGLDETLDPVWAHASLPEGMPVQGNLDPLLVEAGGPALPERVRTIIRAFEDRPHVFNLGHGIGQFTPIEHVEQLLAALRG